DHQDVGVDLAHGDKGSGGAAGNGFSQKLPIAEHVVAVVVRRKSEIQFAGGIVWTIGPTDAAAAGTESMHKPALFVPAGDGEPLHAIGGDARMSRDGRQLLRHGLLESRPADHACWI